MIHTTTPRSCTPVSPRIPFEYALGQVSSIGVNPSIEAGNLLRALQLGGYPRAESNPLAGATHRIGDGRFLCRRLGRRERWTEVHRTHTGRAGPWALRSSLNE